MEPALQYRRYRRSPEPGSPGDERPQSDSPDPVGPARRNQSPKDAHRRIPLLPGRWCRKHCRHSRGSAEIPRTLLLRAVRRFWVRLRSAPPDEETSPAASGDSDCQGLIGTALLRDMLFELTPEMPQTAFNQN